MKKIEMPNFNKAELMYDKLNGYQQEVLEGWFSVYIDPLNEQIENAQVVYGRVTPEHEWFDENGPSATHKAYLIGITPIKKPSREERLEEMLGRMTTEYKKALYNASIFDEELCDQARALLDEEGEE